MIDHSEADGQHLRLHDRQAASTDCGIQWAW